MMWDLEGDLEGNFKENFREDFKQDSEGDLLSSSGLGQVWSRSGSGLVQLRFSLQLKVNSLELDSEVGRLVLLNFWEDFKKPRKRDSEDIFCLKIIFDTFRALFDQKQALWRVL